MAKLLTTSESSHRGWCKRILLSCDCAAHCREEGKGVKLHCAICESSCLMSQTKKMATLSIRKDLALMLQVFLMWFQFIFYPLSRFFFLTQTPDVFSTVCVACESKRIISSPWYNFLHENHCSLFQKSVVLEAC